MYSWDDVSSFTVFRVEISLIFPFNFDIGVLGFYRWELSKLINIVMGKPQDLCEVNCKSYKGATAGNNLARRPKEDECVCNYEGFEAVQKTEAARTDSNIRNNIAKHISYCCSVNIN